LTRKNDALDACPFPPDKPPPPKTLPTNLLEQVDRLFESWRYYLGIITITSLVLAYSLLVVPPPLIKRLTTPDTWNTQLEPRSRPTDILKWIKVREPGYSTSNQMVLEGDQMLEFRDQTVNFTDLVLVKDNAKIILRNSTLIAPSSPRYSSTDVFQEYAGVLFNGSARLKAYNSIIASRAPNIGFIGSSSCYLANSVVANCSLSFDESATLEAVGSTIYAIQADRSSSLKIVDSYVDTIRHSNWWRQMWASPVKEVNASVCLEDSRVRCINVRVVNSSRCQITDIAGEHDNWNIYDAFNMDGATMNITLRRSVVIEPVWVDAINSELNVSGAYVRAVIASMSRVYVENSNVTYLSIYRGY
jgi:hypothetical protein